VASNLHYVARNGFSLRVEDNGDQHTIIFSLDGEECSIPPGEAIDLGEAILTYARVCGHLDKLKRKGDTTLQRRERAGNIATCTAR
jgi:hypothetical protein